MSQVIKRQLAWALGILGLALTLLAVRASALWASVPEGSGGGKVDLPSGGISGTVWVLIGSAIAAGVLLAIVLVVRRSRSRSQAAVVPLKPYASRGITEPAMTSEEPPQSKAA